LEEPQVKQRFSCFNQFIPSSC